MNRDHKQFERLGALAAVGQLTDTELAELEQHANSCASCRSHVSDVAEVSRICFLLHASKIKSGVPEGMQERFMERAAHAGIPLDNRNSVRVPMRSLRVAAIAILVCISTAFGWKTYVRDAGPDSRLEASRHITQPVNTVKPIHASVQDRSIAIASTTVAQMNQTPMKRRQPDSSDARLRQPLPGFEPEVTSIARHGARLPVSSGYALWSQPAALGLADTAHSASTRILLPGAEFLTCMERAEGCRPEIKAFHLDQKLTSFAYLESPVTLSAETYSRSLKFAPPEFHPGSVSSWQHSQ